MSARNPFCRCGHEFLAHYTVHVECVGASCGPRCHDRCVGKGCECRSFALAGPSLAVDPASEDRGPVLVPHDGGGKR